MIIIGQSVAHPSLVCAGDGIDNLRPVQGKHLGTSDGWSVLDGLVLHPMTHDMRCDAALFRQLV